jgi:GT2 family glycosyltransferase
MCLITTKQNHVRIGGFNIKAHYAEDIDYGLRSIQSGARYHLMFKLYLFASTRRKKQMRRRKLSFVYMKWYYETARFGAITDASKYTYKFGDHK